MPARGTITPPWSAADLNNIDDPLQIRHNTAAALALLNPLPAPGEPIWEIDLRKGKIGDGLTRYNSLTYSLGVAGTGTPDVAPQTILGNNDVLGTAVRPASGLTPTQARSVLDVPALTGDYTPFKTAAETHIAAGVTGPISAAGTSTVGSATVTFVSPLPLEFANGQYITGPGIPAYTYVFGVAVDRLSLTMSSNQLSNVPVVAVTGAGAGTFTVRNTLPSAHGLNVRAMPSYDPYQFTATGYSSHVGLSFTPLAPGQWQERWRNGEKYERSYEHPTWQRKHPLTDFSPAWSYLLVPGPFTWTSMPTAVTEFGGHTDGRYRAYVMLQGATQARIVVDQIPTPAVGSAKLKVQYATFPGPTWSDLGSTVIEALITSNSFVQGAWGTISAAAKAVAAAAGDSLWLRVAGSASSAPGSPVLGNVRIEGQ